MTEEIEQKEIELRSEKVRNIVGQVPPVILRKGILIISFAIFVLLVIAWFLPYPETITIKIKLYSTPQSTMICAPEDGFFQYDPKFGIGCIRTDNDSTIEIKFPSNGNVIMNSKSNSLVNKGDILYVVIPDSIYDLSVVGYVAGNDAGKVARNQKVKMEIQASVFQKSISVSGCVSEIYPVPNPEGYKIEIDVTDKRQLSLLENLKLSSLLQGKGKIIVSNQSVLRRFLR